MRELTDNELLVAVVTKLSLTTVQRERAERAKNAEDISAQLHLLITIALAVVGVTGRLHIYDNDRSARHPFLLPPGPNEKGTPV